MNNNIQLLHNVAIQLHACRKKIVMVFYCCVLLFRRSHKTARNRCCVTTLIVYLKAKSRRRRRRRKRKNIHNLDLTMIMVQFILTKERMNSKRAVLKIII